MDKKQALALNRLAKKLSALRKTLRKDERELLDVIVLGSAAAEVSGHAAVSALLTLEAANYVAAATAATAATVAFAAA